MIDDITTRSCRKMYIRTNNDGSKEAYLHFVDGMEMWKYTPEWRGWKLMRIMVGEREVM